MEKESAIIIVICYRQLCYRVTCFSWKNYLSIKKKKAKKKIYFKKAFYRFKNVFVARWTIPSPFLPP